jgi:hypothetical protein
MNILKIITHPYTIIASFFVIMISGQHIGGFYLLYLLLGLPHGAIHSLLALSGIILLLISYNKFKKNRNYMLGRVINIVGLILLLLSLFFFFYKDKQHYNYGTFYQLIPQITLTIFSVLTFAFLLNNLLSIFKNGSKNRVGINS